jgi:hypothetical protein
LSWNVKQFQGDSVRAGVVAGMIRALDPDVFGIIEFLAKDVALSIISDGFDDYDFAGGSRCRWCWRTTPDTGSPPSRGCDGRTSIWRAGRSYGGRRMTSRAMSIRSL